MMQSNQLLPLYTAAQTRALDRYLIEKTGVAGIQLMKAAGRAAFRQIPLFWADAKHILVVCGAGNNAGDGFIIARLAQEAGLTVHLICLADPGVLKGDALLPISGCKMWVLSHRPILPTCW